MEVEMDVAVPMDAHGTPIDAHTIDAHRRKNASLGQKAVAKPRAVALDSI
jgi:hypothetical protein